MSKKTSHISSAALVCLFAATVVVTGFWRGAKAQADVRDRPGRDGTSGPVKADLSATPAGRRALTDGFGISSVSFLPVDGQTDGSIRFCARGSNKTVYFAPDGLTFDLRRPTRGHGESGPEPRVVKLAFLGARGDAVPEGQERAEARLSGPERTPTVREAEAPGFSRIIYRELWPGIDLVYKGGADKLNYEFIVHPGADPSQIKLVYRGIETIALTEEGRLAVQTPAGDYEEDIPAAYQEEDGGRKAVEVTLSLEDTVLSQSPEGDSGPRTATADGPGRRVLAVGFDVGAYQRTRTLTLSTATGYFGRKTGTTSIEVTGGHAGGSQFTLSSGQWIARIGVLGYMKNAPANGTLAIYKNTGIPDIKLHVCHTVTGPMPVGPANKAWTVLPVADGPVWLEPGDYWILRNDSGNYNNKFVITGQDMGKSSWGWFYTDYPDWPSTTEYLSWVENYSNVEGCFYAEWDGGVPGPTITSLVPNTANAGDPGFLLSVAGSGFVSGAAVRWGGSPRTTTFVSSTEVDAEIAAADLTSGKTVQVAVVNPNGGLSNVLPFAINNPVPALDSISPTRATGGGGAFTLTALGSQFVPNSVVLWNGSARTTTYVGAGELEAAIQANDLATGGAIPVTVYNPAPSGGSTAALTLEVSTFSMTPTPSSATVTAGQSTSYEIQLTPQYGSFLSPVSFSCSNLPSNCTASFSPDSVIPGTGSVSTTLTLTTKAESSPGGGAIVDTAGPGSFAVILAALLTALLPAVAGHARLRRGILGRLVAAFILVGAVLFAGSCSSNPAPTGTPKGTHRITVKGTSGTMTVSTVITLVVQ